MSTFNIDEIILQTEIQVCNGLLQSVLHLGREIYQNKHSNIKEDRINRLVNSMLVLYQELGKLPL